MQKSFSGHSVPTHLSSPIVGAGDTTLQVASISGWPNPGVNNFPFVITVDWGLATEEKILCASYSGTAPGTVTVFPSVGRGWDGTTAQAHGVGVDGQVVHTIDAETISKHDAFVFSIGTVAPQPSRVGDNAVTGATGIPADAGHIHAREVFGTDISSNTPGQQANSGSGGKVAQSNHAHATAAAYVPPSRAGEVVMWTSASLPALALLCDGALYSNSSYPALAAAIGNTFGGVAGTSFKVPDFRGVSPIGAGTPNATLTPTTTGATSRSLAAFYGAETVTLSSSQIPALAGTAQAQATTVTNGACTVAGGDTANAILTKNTTSTLFTNAGANIDHVGAWNVGANPLTFTPNVSVSNTASSVSIPNASVGTVPNIHPVLAINFIIMTA